MNKKLLAAAIAASFGSVAYAQNVTIGGSVDTGINQIDFKGNKVTTVASNNSSTSVVQIGGSEDLGGGMRAHWQWEMAPALTETSSRTAGTAATGTTSNITSFFGNGNSWVGLRGAFGDIRFGTPNLSTLFINGDGNSGFATAIGSGYRVSSFDAVRLQNSVRYDSPTINGFAASVVHVPKNDKQSLTGATGLTGNLQNQTNGRDGATEFGLSYIQGPIGVRAATLRMDQFADLLSSSGGAVFTPTAVAPATMGANFRLDSLSARYALMPNFTVAYFYQKVTSDTLSAADTSSTTTTGTVKFNRETNGISGAYVMGATTFRVNYQEVKNGANAATVSAAGTTSTSANIANKETKVIGLGVDYALSKRTSAYVRYEENRDSAGLRAVTGYTAATGNTTYKATGAGIRHSF